MGAQNTETVPASLARLEASFFDSALRKAGVTHSEVVSVSMEPLAFSGAVADMARIHLQYRASSGRGPDSVVAKIRGATETRQQMDQLMGLYQREARFYGELADKIPLQTPRCYHVGDGSQTPLLLEDLGGLRAGDQSRGLGLADANRLMDALAVFHAAFWDTSAPEMDWLASPAQGSYAQMVCQLVNSGVATLVEVYRDRVDASVLDAVSAIAPRWDEVLRRCADGPQTLIHNDCRLDNIFFDDRGEPVFVDWQLPARSRGVQDVANLLAGSMNLDLLNGHWQALLKRYHLGLQRCGVDDYSWEDCLGHYRQNILYPLGAGIALLGDLVMNDDRGVRDAMILRPLLHCAQLDAFNSL